MTFQNSGNHMRRLLITQSTEKLLFSCRRFFGALPEFFRGWAESAFCRDDADRKWLRLRSEVQELYSVSETVTKVYRNGNAAPRFDGRHDTGHAVMLLDDARFLFHLRKGDQEYVGVIRVVFAGESNQWFGGELSQRMCQAEARWCARRGVYGR